MKTTISTIISFLFFLIIPLQAELRLSPLFNDGAVFQQKKPIPVWGWAESGKTIQVSFKGQTVSTQSNADGKWMLRLNPHAADSKGADMTVTTGDEKKVIRDILVGEVWVCGGQSNMDFTLRMLSGRARDPKDEPLGEFIRQEIKTANDPLLRQIKVQRNTSAFKAQESFQGKWSKAVPGEALHFTATGYFFAKELRAKLGVPVGLLNCNWGGTKVEPWIPMDAFNQTPELKAYYEKEVKGIQERMVHWNSGQVKKKFDERLRNYQERVKAAKAKGKKGGFGRRPRMPRRPDTSNGIPSTLYNGMMHALVPYAIQGAIWYQGESNAGHYPERYQKHFSTMIKAWRKNWGQGEFPFYFCQLAQFKEPNKEPLGENGWVTVCDQQRLTLSLKNTGMAVLNDVGEAKDIHPKNKMDAGKRLSLWALKFVYGKGMMVHSGPLYKRSVVKGQKVLVQFDEVGSGLMVGKKNLLDPTVEVNEPLKYFQICGKDRKWRWAEAKIISKDTVEVYHPEIEKPDEVRYAWSPNALGANLYNKEGLPASLFKTK